MGFSAVLRTFRMASLACKALAAVYIGLLVHTGLAAVPAAERLQDAAACRQQQAYPGIEPARQLHCSRVLP